MIQVTRFQGLKVLISQKTLGVEVSKSHGVQVWRSEGLKVWKPDGWFWPTVWLHIGSEFVLSLLFANCDGPLWRGNQNLMRIGCGPPVLWPTMTIRALFGAVLSCIEWITLVAFSDSWISQRGPLSLSGTRCCNELLLEPIRPGHPTLTTAWEEEENPHYICMWHSKSFAKQVLWYWNHFVMKSCQRNKSY